MMECVEDYFPRLDVKNRVGNAILKIIANSGPFSKLNDHEYIALVHTTL